MFKDLILIYKIGKELGLNKTEINRTFLSSRNRSLIVKFLLIFALALTAIVVVIVLVAGSRSVYPSGTLYSSVKLKDFGHKK